MKEFADPPLPEREKVNAYFETQSSFWKDIYTEGGVFAEIHRDRHIAALRWVESLDLAPDSRVLEIGCGAGFLAIALAQRGLRVHAIDAVESMVVQARHHAEEAGVADALCVEAGDAYSLAFEDGCFDLVIALGVLPWLEQPEQAIREMARVARLGGYVILTADNRMRLNRLLDPWLNPAIAPLKRGMKRVLKQVGLLRSPGKKEQSIFHTFHDCHSIDQVLARNGLVKTRGMTLGFGPLTIARHKALPEPLSTALHRWLQGLADRGVPGFRSTGSQYLVQTRKSASRSVPISISSEELAPDITNIL